MVQGVNNMGETVDEAALQHVREMEVYQSVIGALMDMAEDGDPEAGATLSVIDSIIPRKGPEDDKK